MNGLVRSSAIGVVGMPFSSERLKPLSPTTLVMPGLLGIHVFAWQTGNVFGRHKPGDDG